MIQLKISQFGNSVGVILPKEVLARLKVEKGDVVYLTDSPDGFRISAKDPNFERQMDAAKSIMKRYRNALAELAK
jgi:putative addiction module antidote